MIIKSKVSKAAKNDHLEEVGYLLEQGADSDIVLKKF